MADAFVEDEGKKSEHLPIPDSFLFPIPDSAELFIDMGAEQYVMTGSFPGIGTGGFASVKNGEEADYVFAFALAESFHFSGITQTLGILDQMFQVENAGLLISTFDAESVESLFSRIACKLIPTELTQYQDAVKQGLFLYGTFRFSGMLERTFCMLTGMETSPKLSVAAALPKEESGAVIAADLDNLSLIFVWRPLRS